MTKIAKTDYKMGNLNNCCSRERESFDENLNSELNMAAKPKPGEKGDDAGNSGRVDFESIEKLREEQMEDVTIDEDGGSSGPAAGQMNLEEMD